MTEKSRRSCLDKALELLGRRAHFRRELEQKLLRRQYPPAEVAAALERLRELGMLDDPRTAAHYVETRSSRAPAGRRLLRAELAKRGVRGEEGASATAEVDELALASDAARRFLRRRARPGEGAREKLAALARHLGARGFAAATIGRVLEAQREAADDDALPFIADSDPEESDDNEGMESGDDTSEDRL